MVEDAGRGYRRVVPSPEPLVIHGVNQIKALIDQAIVISSGGGGIPVYRDENGNIQGVEAVIDKDRSGLKLAQQVEDTFMMLTDVSNVCVNFGKPNEKKLATISVEQAKLMLPKGNSLQEVCYLRLKLRFNLLKWVKKRLSVH